MSSSSSCTSSSSPPPFTLSLLDRQKAYLDKLAADRRKQQLQQRRQQPKINAANGLKPIMMSASQSNSSSSSSLSSSTPLPLSLSRRDESLISSSQGRLVSVLG